jgi:hypothetical protein
LASIALATSPISKTKISAWYIRIKKCGTFAIWGEYVSSQRMSSLKLQTRDRQSYKNKSLSVKSYEMFSLCFLPTRKELPKALTKNPGIDKRNLQISRAKNIEKTGESQEKNEDQFLADTLNRVKTL